jgi:hypothetical protein
VTWIKVVKIKDCKDVHHPKNIVPGSEHIGIMAKKPTVGEGFLVQTMSTFFITSEVTEIIDDNAFKTLNSIYRIFKLDKRNLLIEKNNF